MQIAILLALFSRDTWTYIMKSKRSSKSLLIFSVLSKINLEKASKELGLIMVLNM